MMTKAIYYYNNASDKPITRRWLRLEDLTAWELEDRPAFEAIWRIPGFFADLPFMDDMAQGVLKTLKEDGHEIVIVSAVPTWESCKDKYSFAHTHLRIPGIIDSMEQVILTRGKKYIDKRDCIMVDDKPSNLEGAGYPIIFNRPWNVRAGVDRRAFRWDDVYAHVKSITKGGAYSGWTSQSWHLGGCV